MKIIKSILIAFSLYSRLPVPVFKWEDDEYDHAITFLPLIGAVIAALIFMLMRGYEFFSPYITDVWGRGAENGSQLNFDAATDLLLSLAVAALMALIPMLVTGGFHLDGYMDVADARNSFADKEKRLEIMKDPHIGAFAIISLVKLGLLYFASLALLVRNWRVTGEKKYLEVYALSFMIVRAACAITCYALPKAKPDGMLQRETGGLKRSDASVLLKELGIALILSVFLDVWSTVTVIVGLLVFIYYYIRFTGEDFGGVTGDTAGYFVVMGETLSLALLAVCALAGI